MDYTTDKGFPHTQASSTNAVPTTPTNNMPEEIWINHGDMLDVQAHVKSADGNDTSYTRSDKHEEVKILLKELVWLLENHEGNYKLESKPLLDRYHKALTQAEKALR